jgi:hypothetical protein
MCQRDDSLMMMLMGGRGVEKRKEKMLKMDGLT